jgi:serine/threonine-protein kinase RsbW
MTPSICAPPADNIQTGRWAQEYSLSDHTFQIESLATIETVRGILADLRTKMAVIGLSEAQCVLVELALAEVLNNIVEHAYAPSCAGHLRLRAWQIDHRLRVEVHDEGAPMPGLRLPDARLPCASGPLQSLPEGGFGWFLIHELCDRLTYTRIGNRNQLLLEFDLKSD